MGCPQGSVLGLTLWNVLLDDLLRLPFPAGVKVVAYADDVTVLVEAPSRSEIEGRSQAALNLIREWGGRNRLSFSPTKSCSMTVKGRLQKPPVVRMGGTLSEPSPRPQCWGWLLTSGSRLQSTRNT
ncbi:Retrovirus-related Pol polyprotein from type-1 retrotransposable element R1 [Eumeta japonica]|uniref:Retrovirus-related Pol polyprotein from type-1 retrotransposable element R1 n=1 Tax=Eumeta variegata TaxID=151549 RepID=A0A4C1UAZ0_EUMVA|nr:Retrovirus-related Pol polyprotein from type-1 retrotransposable element R1 [Eumeta japonica]